MILLFIYRIISAIVTITIVAPLWIAYCIIAFLFSLFNNLIYVNLIDMEVPNDVLQQHAAYNMTILKILTAISIPIVQFWHNLKNIKSIKF